MAALTWVPISDGQFKTGSVGAIAVADSDPNVIYVGMGEACVRGNASHGDGVYKSRRCRQDLAQCRPAGQLPHRRRSRSSEESRHRLRGGARPSLGAERKRGVYRTTDGGATWKQVLKRSNDAGAVDIAMDPTNPRVLYAALLGDQPQALAHG